MPYLVVVYGPPLSGKTTAARQIAGSLDGKRDLDPAPRGQVLELGLQPLVGRAGERVGLRHGAKGTGRG